jgi:hypothetical protein
MGNIRVAENCKQVNVVTVEEAKKLDKQYNQEGLYDDRNAMMCYKNTFDMVMYLNYLDMCKQLSQTYNAGRFHYMLDLGFVPVVMSPFFMGDNFHQLLIPKMEQKNIPYRKLPATSFVNDWYKNSNPDVWVSKLEVAPILGKSPESIRVKNILEAII